MPRVRLLPHRRREWRRAPGEVSPRPASRCALDDRANDQKSGPGRHECMPPQSPHAARQGGPIGLSPKGTHGGRVSKGPLRWFGLLAFGGVILGLIGHYIRFGPRTPTPSPPPEPGKGDTR